MNHLVQCFWIGLAGAAGALARFGVGAMIGRAVERFPLGTMVINVVGSFIIGWFLVFMARFPITQNTSNVRLAIATGFVGAFTTFSTLMYDSAHLFERGAGLAAAGNLVGSVALGLLAVWLGMSLGRAM